MVRVVNIRDLESGWTSDPSYIYIGRAGHGLKGPLGNPFSIGSRSKVIADFRSWMQITKSAEFLNALRSIPKDAILVCFCAPLDCHGDVIAAHINSQYNEMES